ncbi:hypothetical protein L218DRAFT_1075062 [Marasmius fiardii PR-910]|nr:hypothetical protein L218DRAFT_1075062 [Marasmius fiardii PR-910]
MTFVGASQISVAGDVNNYIQGTQNIIYTTPAFQEQRRERTIYDEFPYIQRGLVFRIRVLHREDHIIRRSCGFEEEFEAERTIGTAEIHGSNSRFTVVSYKGRDAAKAWERDFRRWSELADTTNMQLFGINRSSIPFLLFHRELVPLAHFAHRIGVFGKLYALTLAWNTLTCNEHWLWMDPKQETFVCGMEGPKKSLGRYRIDLEGLSSNAGFVLQESVAWRFFSELPLDKAFDKSIVLALHGHQRRPVRRLEQCICHPPHVFSNLDNTTIALGSPAWKTGYDRIECLGSPVLMPDGRMRFCLRLEERQSSFQLTSDEDDSACAWLSQASSVFCKLGISLNENVFDYKLMSPWIWLKGSIDDSEVAHQRRSEVAPIFLFLNPLHLFPPFKKGSCISIHTWATDENGQACIPRGRCDHLGLPTELYVEHLLTYEFSWPTETYRTIHKWQVARGFNPNIADFVHFLEYPTWEVLPQQVEEPDTETSGSSTSVVARSRMGDQQRSTFSMIWSAITAPLTSAACDESEISVALM